MARSVKGSIRGKVADVAAPYELVINLGSNHGVEKGSLFQVLERKSETVTDPDDPDGAPLGNIRRVSTIVRASDVSERMTVARTFREFEELADKSFKAMTRISFFNPPETEWVQEKFREARSETDEGGVAIGDEVVLVPSGVDEDEISRTIIDP